MKYPKKMSLSTIEYRGSKFSIAPPFTVYISVLNGGKSFMARCEDVGDSLNVEDTTPNGALNTLCSKIILIWDDAMDEAKRKWSIPNESDLFFFSRMLEVSDGSDEIDDILEDGFETLLKKYLIK